MPPRALAARGVWKLMDLVRRGPTVERVPSPGIDSEQFERENKDAESDVDMEAAADTTATADEHQAADTTAAAKKAQIDAFDIEFMSSSRVDPSRADDWSGDTGEEAAMWAALAASEATSETGDKPRHENGEPKAEGGSSDVEMEPEDKPKDNGEPKAEGGPSDVEMEQKDKPNDEPPQSETPQPEKPKEETPQAPNADKPQVSTSKLTI